VGPTSGYGQAACVARETERAGELALGDREGAQGYVKLISDLLRGERSLDAKQAAGANERYDGATRPRLRPAVTNDTKASTVGEDPPRGLRVASSKAASAVRGGQRGGALTGRAVVPPGWRSGAHPHEYRRLPEAPAAAPSPLHMPVPRRSSVA
jgi:hypothetical protein